MDNLRSFESFNKSKYRSIKLSSYFSAYDALFSKYIGKPITFLEIGVLGGGSLFMWRDFFGDNARIIGVDLNPGAKKWEKYGFEIYIGDQCDENFWRQLLAEVGEIDVVLDDGGHTYAQQIITFESLISSIRDGGVLVVEDTHTSYMLGYGIKSYSFIEYAKLLADRINKRFSGLSSACDERRVWSIRFFDSMVAFDINRKEQIASTIVDNNGHDDKAIDYLYHDEGHVVIIKKLVSKFGAKYSEAKIFKFMWNILKELILLPRFIKEKSKIKKYFINSKRL